jgi:hypothetical protein
MADFEGLMDQISLLKSWSGEPPTGVRLAAAPADSAARIEILSRSGERHGSWFLEMTWAADGLTRSAVLALTNPTALPDVTTARVVVTARAGASSATRYVSETVVDQRRAIARVSEGDFQAWLLAAVERARGYTEASLNQAYSTGIGQ